jgi:GntR family transcriptional regulator, transcriptional repressor for pyruvate dehydrogenase complex
MGIQPIKKANISEQVFEQLKQQLLLGEWKQGDKIPSENELAVAFGVSRVTVRQALQKLTVLGLIETRLGEGSFVKEVKLGMHMNTLIPMAYLGDQSLLEVLEFRQVVEVKTAELAAKRATDQDIEDLERIFNLMMDHKDDPHKFSEDDLDFHLKIAEITNNSLIIETHNIIKDILSVAMHKIVSERGNTAGLHYHKMLLEAIRERNAEKARELMAQHVDDTYEMMSRLHNDQKEKI